MMRPWKSGIFSWPVLTLFILVLTLAAGANPDPEPPDKPVEAQPADPEEVADERIPLAVPRKQDRAAGKLTLSLRNEMGAPGFQAELRLKHAVGPVDGDEVGPGRGHRSASAARDPAASARL